MNYQIDFPLEGYPPSYSNASRQEGLWSQEVYFDTQSPASYQSTRGSPQPPEDGPTPAPDYAGFSVINTAQGYVGSFSTRGPVVHPILGTVTVDMRYGDVMKVYGPPVDQVYPNIPDVPPSRVMLPLRSYACGNTQKNWDRKPPIGFSTMGRPGVKLLNAANGEFKGIDDRDDSPFDAVCRGITIRIHFSGYPSSTKVERRLKREADKDERPKARSMQLSTKNYRVPPDPVTKSKLAQEVSKRIQWHITDLRANSDLFPFDDRVDEKWRLGQGKMKFEHMVITELDNVSSGSWSPVIWIE